MENMEDIIVTLNESDLSEVSGGTRTVTCVKYKVKSGDTLSHLANKYGTTIAKIMELNPKIENKDLIKAGWVLYIPVKS